ncbi:CRISPR-associated helicase Cas3' [Streptomyces profundus]|nr:CRISPR-associated helicase Cas3' [Streptomyces sp. MA3_2.13]
MGVEVNGEELYAHSRCAGSGVRHGLAEHLRGTAALAGRFGGVFGAAELAEYLALVHDVGKGCCAWQNTLINHAEPNDKPVGIPHKDAGAWLAQEYTSKMLAAVVHGHHGGLSERNRVAEVVKNVRSGTDADARNARESVDAVSAVVPEILPGQRLALPAWLGALPARERGLGKDLLIRMLFSCLVDADYLDTAAHFDGTGTPRVAGDADMAVLGARFETRRAEFLAGREPSRVDAIRSGVYEQALAAAEREPGLYVLHVPTGGGKTLASAGFALRHAARHRMGRIVFAVPFISITEQNAAVYRDLLDPHRGEPGGPVVLEHHSSADLEEEVAGPWARLAAENWDAPVVVTTTVQLFQSLFSHRPAAMRKLHRLAGSVIVLDEVQALPDRLLAPILSVLRGLVDHFGASVVLASATQPEFWARPEWDGAARHLVVDDVSTLFDELRRVTYHWRSDEGGSWETIAEEILEEPGSRVLTVVNTTRDAATLHRLLAEALAPADDDLADADEASERPMVLHLSTRMTAGHRREVIDLIRKRLAERQPTFVVSTSLIEAGVDLDFPCVYRAVAPAESMQQAAGRCNRDGRDDDGRVVIFRPAEGGDPKSKSYKAAKEASERFFGPELAAPDDLAALSSYYAERYAAQGSDGRAFGEEIQRLRRELDFPEVARSFQMIDDAYSQPVVVIRPELTEAERDVIEADIKSLGDPYPTGPEVWRRLQPHTASLPRHEVREALNNRLADLVVGDLVVWRGFYDPLRGLDSERVEDPTAFLV